MFKQEMMKFWDWDSEIGNGWHACSVPTNFSPFYYLPENKFLPLLLFAGKQIVANGSTLHWERRRKKRKQIPNWRRRKTNSFLRHPKIWVYLFLITCKYVRAEWDSLCFRSKESNYTFSPKARNSDSSDFNGKLGILSEFQTFNNRVKGKKSKKKDKKMNRQ